MDNWKKVSLVTSAILILVLSSLIYFLNITISIPSSDIAFSPDNSATFSLSDSSFTRPKNIIVFMVDGMGFGHLSLAMLTKQTENESSVWNEFDFKGWHDPRSIYGPLTDSEASATAISTGISTNFGHIAIDKDGYHLQTLLEKASEHGYTTGIVTDSYVWDGTPAAFIAHTRNEDDARDILKQIAESDLDVLFGELEDVGEDDVPETVESFEIIEQRFQILNRALELPTGLDFDQPVAAIFEEDEIQDMNSSPNLVQLTNTALSYLTNQDAPFVLLVESEEMDAASHNNDSKRVIRGLTSIQESLKVVIEYVNEHPETLVIFTADHETGGFAAVSDFNNYPNMQIRWSTKNHTASIVPLFAKGPGAQLFSDVQRNWEIGKLLQYMINE